jgi:hypothetical protein
MEQKMSQTLTCIFTKRPWWNPVGLLIRWAIPRSRFALAVSNHCMLVDGDDYVIHATMLHGVVRQLKADALKGQIVVATRHYQVQDAEAGLKWARGEIGKPYDFQGAFGTSLAPDREWQKNDAWYCYELFAAALERAGRVLFRQYGHVTDSMLLMVAP